MTASEVAVAVNFQIDPDEQGGIQSSALSLLGRMHWQAHGIRPTVLPLDSATARLATLTPPEVAVHPWPASEIGTITGALPGQFGQWQTSPLYPRAVGNWLVKSLRGVRAEIRRRPAAQNDGLLRAAGIDLVHFPYPRRFATKLPFIYEPHDLQHLHLPQFFSREEHAWREAEYAGGCRDAELVLCGSQWTKADIVDAYAIDPRRIAVVPRGAMTPPSQTSCADNHVSLNLPKQYALYPATSFEHKNHVRLVEAWARLNRSGIRLPLVFTGRTNTPHFGAIRAAIEHHQLAELVQVLGPVPLSRLRDLYSQAQMIVFPSLFEGLSQALLVALELGLPIVAATATSIPETLGDAALYFDGQDVTDMTRTLAGAIANPAQLRLAQQKTNAQFARYSWDDASAMLAACYKVAAGRRLDSNEQDWLERAIG